MGQLLQIDCRRGVNRATLIVLIVGVLLHAGCASTDSDDWTEIEDTAARSVRHTVVAGDNLSIIAQDVTGDSNNWSAIAEHNGITDPRRLSIGAVVEVPGSLIPRPQSAANTALDASDSRESASNTLAVATSQDAGKPVVVSPVESNRNFELAPLDKNGDDRYSAERYVKVIGTYYPRAIYAEPAGYSRLIARVFPGTVMPLEREIGDWLRVTTDDGSGYLRSSDGEIMSASEHSASLPD